MHRTLRAPVAALILAILLAPPAAWATGHRKGEPCASQPAPATLPDTTRGSLEPDAKTVPQFPVDGENSGNAAHYRLLIARDCQCLAVQHAPLASTLARDRQALADAHPCCQHPIVHLLLPCHCDDRASKLKQCILYYAELEARNRSAGAALELFYRIAEFEVKDDLLAAGIAAVGGGYDQAKSVADQGFKLPIELESLHRQQLDARADRVRVQAALTEFNGKLKGLIGQSDLPFCERLWPGADFAISLAPIDADAAIQTALAERAELKLLRTLNCELDARTLPVIREFLKGLNAALGAQALSNSPLGRMVDSVKLLLTRHALEKALRSGQIEQLLAEREKAVADEVRQAIAQINAQGQLVDLERQRVLAWQARVQEVEDRLGQGESTFLDLLSAKLDWYKARASLTAGIMGWHRAQVQLRLAQGVLVMECCDCAQ
jgi:outer membrane efflux protein